MSFMCSKRRLNKLNLVSLDRSNIIGSLISKFAGGSTGVSIPIAGIPVSP